MRSDFGRGLNKLPAAQTSALIIPITLGFLFMGGADEKDQKGRNRTQLPPDFRK